MFSPPNGRGLGDVDLGRPTVGVSSVVFECCRSFPFQRGFSGSVTGATEDALVDSLATEDEVAAGDGPVVGVRSFKGLLLAFARTAELAKKFGIPLDTEGALDDVELFEATVVGGAAKKELDGAPLSFLVVDCSGVGGTISSFGGWTASSVLSVVAIFTDSGV